MAIISLLLVGVLTLGFVQVTLACTIETSDVVGDCGSCTATALGSMTGGTVYTGYVERHTCSAQSLGRRSSALSTWIAAVIEKALENNPSVVVHSYQYAAFAQSMVSKLRSQGMTLEQRAELMPAVAIAVKDVSSNLFGEIIAGVVEAAEEALEGGKAAARSIQDAIESARAKAEAAARAAADAARRAADAAAAAAKAAAQKVTSFFSGWGKRRR